MTHDEASLLRDVSSSTASDPGQSANGAIRGRFPRDVHHFFVEEAWVSRRLFETIVPQVAPGEAPFILDPAAGVGQIVRSARAHGLRAAGTDLVKRSRLVAGGRDFLAENYRAPDPGAAPLWIVCNPPFKRLREFCERALERVPRFGRVAMMAPTRRLNGAHRWLPHLPLTEVLYVTPRPSCWPGEIFASRTAAGKRLGGGREDFCWLLFETGARFEGRVGWLRRDG